MSCKPKKLGCKIKIPKIGLGTWRLHDSMKTEAALYKALELGYRHLDTAYIYGNEVSIGKALKRWFKKGHSRKELFITSKLPPFGLRDEDVSRYLCETLKRLQLQYIDLYLTHVPFGFFASKSITLDHQNAGSWNWPSSLNTKNAIKWDYATDHVEVWKAMEQEVDLKRTRHIGLSNFNISQIENVLKHCRIKPACLQVEIHPYLQQKKLSVFCHNNDIVLVAYSPFGSMGNSVSDDFAPAMYDTTVEDIARELGVTPAQVVLAYIMHLGAIPIPQTDDPNYLKDNLAAVNIKLNKDQIERMAKLDKGEEGRIFNFRQWDGVIRHPEYPWDQPSDMRIRSSNFLSTIREQTNKCCGGCTVYLHSAGGWKQIQQDLSHSFKPAAESELYFKIKKPKIFPDLKTLDLVTLSTVKDKVINLNKSTKPKESLPTPPAKDHGWSKDTTSKALIVFPKQESQDSMDFITKFRSTEYGKFIEKICKGFYKSLILDNKSCTLCKKINDYCRKSFKKQSSVGPNRRPKSSKMPSLYRPKSAGKRISVNKSADVPRKSANVNYKAVDLPFQNAPHSIIHSQSEANKKNLDYVKMSVSGCGCIPKVNMPSKASVSKMKEEYKDCSKKCIDSLKKAASASRLIKKPICGSVDGPDINSEFKDCTKKSPSCLQKSANYRNCAKKQLIYAGKSASAENIPVQQLIIPGQAKSVPEKQDLNESKKKTKIYFTICPNCGYSASKRNKRLPKWAQKSARKSQSCERPKSDKTSNKCLAVKSDILKSCEVKCPAKPSKSVSETKCAESEPYTAVTKDGIRTEKSSTVVHLWKERKGSKSKLKSPRRKVSSKCCVPVKKYQRSLTYQDKLAAHSKNKKCSSNCEPKRPLTCKKSVDSPTRKNHTFTRNLCTNDLKTDASSVPAQAAKNTKSKSKLSCTTSDGSISRKGKPPMCIGTTTLNMHPKLPNPISSSTKIYKSLRHDKNDDYIPNAQFPRKVVYHKHSNTNVALKIPKLFDIVRSQSCSCGRRDCPHQVDQVWEPEKQPDASRFLKSCNSFMTNKHISKLRARSQSPNNDNGEGTYPFKITNSLRSFFSKITSSITRFTHSDCCNDKKGVGNMDYLTDNKAKADTEKSFHEIFASTDINKRDPTSVDTCIDDKSVFKPKWNVDGEKIIAKELVNTFTTNAPKNAFNDESMNNEIGVKHSAQSGSPYRIQNCSCPNQGCPWQQSSSNCPCRNRSRCPCQNQGCPLNNQSCPCMNQQGCPFRNQNCPCRQSPCGCPNCPRRRQNCPFSNCGCGNSNCGCRNRCCQCGQSLNIVIRSSCPCMQTGTCPCGGNLPCPCGVQSASSQPCPCGKEGCQCKKSGDKNVQTKCSCGNQPCTCGATPGIGLTPGSKCTCGNQPCTCGAVVATKADPAIATVKQELFKKKEPCPCADKGCKCAETGICICPKRRRKNLKDPK